MTLEETLKIKIEFAKQELTERQNNFRKWVDSDINTAAFEQNAITELLLMMECKMYLKTLENNLLLAQIDSNKDGETAHNKN
jgi:hypothetical protein